jgi:hypothetical protein
MSDGDFYENMMSEKENKCIVRVYTRAKSCLKYISGGEDAEIIPSRYKTQVPHLRSINHDFLSYRLPSLSGEDAERCVWSMANLAKV